MRNLHFKGLRFTDAGILREPKRGFAIDLAPEFRTRKDHAEVFD